MSSRRNVSAMVASLAPRPMTRIERLAASGARNGLPVSAASNLRNTQEPGFQAYSPEVAYAPGERVLLPLTQVGENPRNPRVFFSEEALQGLVKSIAQAGLQTAIQVYPSGETGTYTLKSGHRRVRALKLLGHTHVKAEIVAPSGDLLQDYREAREINREHRSHSHFDDAVRFRQLLESGEVKEQQQLADMLGITESEVSKHLAIGRLPLNVLSAMAESPSRCGLTASYQLHRYWDASGASEESMLKLVKRVLDGKVTTRQLEALNQAAKPVTSERKREHALSRAEVRGSATGELKAFDGKLVLKLTDMSNETRDVLFRKLLQAIRDAGLDVGRGAVDAGGKEDASSA